MNPNRIDAPVPGFTPVHASLLIAGQQVEGERRLHICNPAYPDEIVGTIVRGTPADVEQAVTAAHKAQPAWAALSFTARAAYLARALDLIDQDIPERATLYVRENGRTLAEAMAELSDVSRRQRLTLELAVELDRPRVLAAPGGRTVIATLPFGVVVSIAPWNAPVSLGCMQWIPALLAGNAVILKPPETCPLTLVATATLIAGALPPGVVNIVTGLPQEIGDALTRHPRIAKIGFTGSIPSARGIICNAAETIKSVTAELGGNDAAIVLEDADLGPAAMARMATIIFRLAGQVCMAIKRIYVADAIHDRFVDALATAVDKIVVGDGLASGVTMGPLHSAAALQRAAAIIADARDRGATIRTLGQVSDPTVFANGHFLRPTIVTDVPDDARIMVEEQFCPAIPIVRFADVEEAIERANATIFGLGGSVWSGDIDRAVVLALRLQAGSVFVNTHGTNSVNRQAPYGGVKQSGAGRRAGIEGVHEYLQLQTLTTDER